MFVLHYVFEARIKNDLDLLREAHNNHRIRTENNKTPKQLWYQSLIESSNDASRYSSTRNIFESNDTVRRQQIRNFRQNNDLNEPDDISIIIQRIPPPLTQQQLADLSQAVDILASLRVKVLKYMERLLTSLERRKIHRFISFCCIFFTNSILHLVSFDNTYTRLFVL